MATTPGVSVSLAMKLSKEDKFKLRLRRKGARTGMLECHWISLRIHHLGTRKWEINVYLHCLHSDAHCAYMGRDRTGGTCVDIMVLFWHLVVQSSYCVASDRSSVTPGKIVLEDACHKTLCCYYIYSINHSTSLQASKAALHGP